MYRQICMADTDLTTEEGKALIAAQRDLALELVADTDRREAREAWRACACAALTGLLAAGRIDARACAELAGEIADRLLGELQRRGFQAPPSGRAP